MDRSLPAQSGKPELEMDPLHAELHDLCQPLTALRCRLEMSRIASRGDRLEEVIEDALEETRRIFAVVERMRCRLVQEEERSQGLAPRGRAERGRQASERRRKENE